MMIWEQDSFFFSFLTWKLVETCATIVVYGILKCSAPRQLFIAYFVTKSLERFGEKNIVTPTL
jgi:hypothetical protein